MPRFNAVSKAKRKAVAGEDCQDERKLRPIVIDVEGRGQDGVVVGFHRNDFSANDHSVEFGDRVVRMNPQNSRAGPLRAEMQAGAIDDCWGDGARHTRSESPATSPPASPELSCLKRSAAALAAIPALGNFSTGQLASERHDVLCRLYLLNQDLALTIGRGARAEKRLAQARTNRDRVAPPPPSELAPPPSTVEYTAGQGTWYQVDGGGAVWLRSKPDENARTNLVAKAYTLVHAVPDPATPAGWIKTTAELWLPLKYLIGPLDDTLDNNVPRKITVTANDRPVTILDDKDKNRKLAFEFGGAATGGIVVAVIGAAAVICAASAALPIVATSIGTGITLGWEAGSTKAPDSYVEYNMRIEYGAGKVACPRLRWS
eukprot:COSAG02_NODE_3339_length_6902_cov_59.760694_4_plen_373_part_01